MGPVFLARKTYRDGGADKNLDYNLKEVVRVFV